MSSSTDVISLTDGTPAKRKAPSKDSSLKKVKHDMAATAPGKESLAAFSKLIEEEEKAKGRHYFLVKGCTVKKDDEDEDEDDDDKNISLAELLHEKNGVKYLMLTKAANEAVHRAKRVVGDVCFGGKRPHEIVCAIQSKKYVAPTEAEAAKWGFGMGNTSSSYAYYAIFEMETKASLALLRKGDVAGAFNALLGITLAASEEDLWLLDLEDPALPAACIKALGAAWKKVLLSTDEALQIDGPTSRAVLEEKLTAIAKNWATYDSFEEPAYKFAWKPPVKRQPKIAAAAAAGQGEALSSSSSSSSNSATASGAPANALAPYVTLRSPTATKHVLQLRLSSMAAPHSLVCEVCVFDHITSFNLHRALAHAIHAATKGPAREEALNGRRYTLSSEDTTGVSAANNTVVVGVAKAPGVTTNGRTTKATALDWSAPVTYVLWDELDVAPRAYRVECVDVAPVYGKKKSEELGYGWASEQCKVEHAFEDDAMPRCVSHGALGLDGVAKANEKLTRLRFHQNHAMNKKERTGLGRNWFVMAGTTSADFRRMKENFYRGSAAKDIAEVRRGRGY